MGSLRAGPMGGANRVGHKEYGSTPLYVRAQRALLSSKLFVYSSVHAFPLDATQKDGELYFLTTIHYDSTEGQSVMRQTVGNKFSMNNKSVGIQMKPFSIDRYNLFFL